jgi:hypothetical protein
MAWRGLVTFFSAALLACPLYADGNAPLRTKAFELAYNLDHQPAVELLRQGLQKSPDDASLHRALASILWLNMLFSRGAVTVDHYLGSFSRTQIELKKPPPDVDAEFKHHVAKAVELAEKRATANPGDVQAHYDLGAAVGLRASYIATVEGKMLAGFRAARRAFDEHEKVFSLDPVRRFNPVIAGAVDGLCGGVRRRQRPGYRTSSERGRPRERFANRCHVRSRIDL